MTTIATSTDTTANAPRPATPATTRPNLLDRYRPIGIASVLAAALPKAPARAKA